MKLTVLGCAGTFPGPDSPCSSYLLESGGFRLLVDMGNGSLGQLQRHLDLRDVDAVVLSHLHADHCLDLVAYSYALRYHPEGTRPPLPVYGPTGTRERLGNAYDHPPENELLNVFDYRPLAPTIDLGPFTVESALVAHPIEAYGLRVTAGGRSLTYSGDTGACDALVDLARGTDLFLCEASWFDVPDNPPGVHLSGREAGEHATKAEVGSLLLTHLVPWGDRDRTFAEASGAFDGQLRLAEAGVSYEV